jgi:hypothetical protein
VVWEGRLRPWKEEKVLHSPKHPPPVNRRHPPHFKGTTTSPKDECFPLKERPILG